MRGLPLHDADWLRERQSLCRAKGLVIMRSAREALIRLCSCQSQPQTRRTGSGLQKWPPLSRFLFFSSAFEECPGSYWTLKCTVPSQTIGWNDMGSYRKRACAISGGWGARRGPTRRMLSRLRSHPSNSVLSPWQPLRYWRGLWFKGLGSASSGPLDPGLSRLDWAVYFAADWPRPGEPVLSSGKEGRSTRVAGFKMAPASLGDVEGRTWVRPSLLEKRGAEVGLARRVDGAVIGLRRWC